jgi:hypothetical protein
MTLELILVSQVRSNKLFKSITAHIDNNPLVVSRYEIDTGIKITTNIGSNLSNLPSVDDAYYYFVEDLTVHEHSELNIEDITAFLLANSDKCINDSVLSKGQGVSDMSLIMFEFIMGNITGRGIVNRIVDTFP